ncbi:RNA polymerase II C-terminal domain kinase beta subunit [Chytriomyces hyalinus]|nr:RNA polymerase II C-terminal domain kinase beta subunit [Chytriomyces hyalinus]
MEPAPTEEDENEIVTPLFFTSTALQSSPANNQESNDDDAKQRDRIAAGRLVVRLCLRMGFPAHTKAAALQVLNRYVQSRSFSRSKHNQEDLVIACVLVACKLEETVKKTRDLILGLHTLSGNEIDYDDPEVENQKRRVIHIERCVLETLCFDFNQIKSAHKIIVQLAKLMEVPKHVAQKAWFMADESYYTLVATQYPAQFIALAALYLACRVEDCPALPTVWDPKLSHLYFCRLTGVVDICLQIIRHFQQSDWLHSPESEVDLMKLSEVSAYLEEELKSLVAKRVIRVAFFADQPEAAPPMPIVPSVTPFIPHQIMHGAIQHMDPGQMKRPFPYDERAPNVFKRHHSSPPLPPMAFPPPPPHLPPHIRPPPPPHAPNNQPWNQHMHRQPFVANSGGFLPTGTSMGVDARMGGGLRPQVAPPPPPPPPPPGHEGSDFSAAPPLPPPPSASRISFPLFPPAMRGRFGGVGGAGVYRQQQQQQQQQQQGGGGYGGGGGNNSGQEYNAGRR